MAGIDVSVSRELLPGLLGSLDGLAKLVEVVLNQILEAPVTEALGGAAARADGRAHGLPQRIPCTHALHAGGAGDAAGAADEGRQLLERPLQALPAQRASLCPGANGKGRAGRLDAQSGGDHGRAVRGELLEIDGEPPVRAALAAGQGIQRAPPGGRVSVHSGGCAVHPKPAG